MGRRLLRGIRRLIYDMVSAEHQRRTGAAAVYVLQYQITMMIFHDFLHDGESQPCARQPLC